MPVYTGYIRGMYVLWPVTVLVFVGNSMRLIFGEGQATSIPDMYSVYTAHICGSGFVGSMRPVAAYSTVIGGGANASNLLVVWGGHRTGLQVTAIMHAAVRTGNLMARTAAAGERQQHTHGGYADDGGERRMFIHGVLLPLWAVYLFVGLLKQGMVYVRTAWIASAKASSHPCR